MKKYGKAAIILVSGAFIFTAAMGVTNAFLANRTNDLTNEFTPGTVKIELEEPEWKAQAGKNMLPRKTVGKDPFAVNTGKNEEWVFLRVAVPMKTIALVDTVTKKKLPASKVELFTFEVSKQWERIERREEDQAAHYVYAYCRALQPGEKTDSLFREVSMVNYLEGSLDAAETFIIPVEAVSIQRNTGTEEEGLKAVYADYLKQEEANRLDE